MVIGLIAGGDAAIRRAVENAEDDRQQIIDDLKTYNISSNDFLIGIAASGTTPYVLGGIDFCKQNHIPTAGITCNPGCALQKEENFPWMAALVYKLLKGSSRMKVGRAKRL